MASSETLPEHVNVPMLLLLILEYYRGTTATTTTATHFCCINKYFAEIEREALLH